MCCVRPVGVTGSGRHRIRGNSTKTIIKKINVLSGQFAELTAFTNLLKKAFSQVVEDFVAIRIEALLLKAVFNLLTLLTLEGIRLRLGSDCQLVRPHQPGRSVTCVKPPPPGVLRLSVRKLLEKAGRS